MPSRELTGEALTSPRASVEGSETTPLTAGWEVVAREPGEAGAGLPESDRLEWIPASVPGTAAAALRAAGRWDSADGRSISTPRTGGFGPGSTPLRPSPARRCGCASRASPRSPRSILNGELVLAGESMFAPAALDVGALLREGGNELAIRCRALGPLLGCRRKPRARWRTKLVDGRLRFFRTMLLGSRRRASRPGRPRSGPGARSRSSAGAGSPSSACDLRATLDGRGRPARGRRRGCGRLRAPS